MLGRCTGDIREIWLSDHWSGRGVRLRVRVRGRGRGKVRGRVRV